MVQLAHEPAGPARRGREPSASRDPDVHGDPRDSPVGAVSDAPRLSLITTMHNTEAYLREALDSALAQTREDWELVLVDDGSTDASPDIAREYAQRDARIRLHTPGRLGRPGALIRAHEQAKAPLIGWLDADDALEPTAVADLARIFDHNPHVDMVFSDHVIMDEESKVLGIGARCALPYSAHQMLVDFVSFHFRVYSRRIYDAVGGLDDSVSYARDYDLCLKISERATDVRRVRKPLYRYRARPGNISLGHQDEQREHSRLAVEAALVRRGMDETHRIEVSPEGKFRLLRRTSDT
ncbi:MAG: glycosyltransferase [Planctomycetota bacterium]